MVSGLGTVNWKILGIVLVYLVILAGIGLYLKKGIKSGADYWLGGRKNGPITTAISFNASYVSTVVVIGSPAYYFMYGMGYHVIEVLTSTLILGIVLFAAMALKMRAVSERSGAVSLPGFLAVRYESDAAQVISGILIAILMIPYGVAVLKAIGDALNIITGIPYVVGILITAVTAVIYLSASGFLGMSRTDLIQGFTILAGVIVLAVVVVRACGGIETMFTGISREYPELLSIPGPLPWGLFLSYTMIYPLIAFGQPQLVTKFMGMKDTRTMGVVIVTNIIFLFVLLASILGIGLGARYLFAGQSFENMDVVAPLVASVYGATFVSGLFLCGAVAAGLSTFVAIMMSATAALSKDIYEDFIQKKRNRTQSPEKTLILSRLCTVGLIAVTALLSIHPWDVVWQMSAMASGTMGAAFTASMLIGLYWKRATRAGCIASIVGGAAVTLACYAFSLTSAIHPFVPGMAASTALLVAVSLCTKAPDADVIAMFFHKDYKKP